MKITVFSVVNWVTTPGVSESCCNFQIIRKNPKINNFFIDEKSCKTFGTLTRLRALPASPRIGSNSIILQSFYYAICIRNIRDLMGIYSDPNVFQLFSLMKILFIFRFFPMIQKLQQDSETPGVVLQFTTESTIIFILELQSTYPDTNVHAGAT